MPIDLGSVADLGQVAPGAGENLEELGFKRGAVRTKELRGELEDAAGVGDDLDGLNAGDLVEEPAAAGVHELGVAFEFQQIEDEDALGRRESARAACRARKRSTGLAPAVTIGVREWTGILAVKDDLDIGVASGP